MMISHILEAHLETILWYLEKVNDQLVQALKQAISFHVEHRDSDT